MPRRGEQLLLRLAGSSLRLRVTLWTTLVALLIQLVLGTLVFYYQRYALDEMFNARLSARVSFVVKAVDALSKDPTSADLARIAKETLHFPYPEESYIAIFSDGTLQSSSRDGLDALNPGLEIPPTAFARPGRYTVPALKLADADDPWFRLIAYPLNSAGETLLIALSDAPFEERVLLTARILALTLSAGTLATLAAAWLIAGIALKPLSQLPQLTGMLAPEAIRHDAKLEPFPTELAAFQHQLAEARERLRQSIQAQDRLIWNVSHEMKTPIAVVLIEAETIDLTSLPPDAARFVRSVRQEMKRLGGSIETFVLLTRLRGEQTLTDTRVIELHDVVLEAVADTTPFASRCSVALRIQMSEEDDSPLVNGDEQLLATMFGQILNNAVRASAAGSEVVISVAIDQNRCCVRIQDRGGPVPEEMISNFFDRVEGELHRDVEDRRELGLSIAQGIAELHGGLIAVSNREGGGCQFLIHLPLALRGPDEGSKVSDLSDASASGPA